MWWDCSEDLKVVCLLCGSADVEVVALILVTEFQAVSGPSFKDSELELVPESSLGLVSVSHHAERVEVKYKSDL